MPALIFYALTAAAILVPSIIIGAIILDNAAQDIADAFTDADERPARLLASSDVDGEMRGRRGNGAGGGTEQIGDLAEAQVMFRTHHGSADTP